MINYLLRYICKVYCILGFKIRPYIRFFFRLHRRTLVGTAHVKTMAYAHMMIVGMAFLVAVRETFLADIVK